MMQNVPIADLAALQLQMFCFHLLPQVHHRKADKGQDLHSAFYTAPAERTYAMGLGPNGYSRPNCW